MGTSKRFFVLKDKRGYIMGSLTPGATYIYERANGKIYAREYGKTEKKIIGYDLSSAPERMHLTFWNEILKESETNPALQNALDNVIMIYKLSRDRYE
jgi:hypothetical protein